MSEQENKSNDFEVRAGMGTREIKYKDDTLWQSCEEGKE